MAGDDGDDDDGEDGGNDYDDDDYGDDADDHDDDDDGDDDDDDDADDDDDEPKTPKTSSRTPPELLPGSSKPLQNASRASLLDPIWQNLCLFLKFWLNNITSQHLKYSLGPIHSMHFTSLCFIFVGHWFPF